MRWYVGNTIAEYTATPDADGIEMVRMATPLGAGRRAAPLAARVFRKEKNFSAEKPGRVSPRIRTCRARLNLMIIVTGWNSGARWKLPATTPAERKALRRAVELAPSYSHPRWQYGNLLLRQGRTDDAFAQLFARRPKQTN